MRSNTFKSLIKSGLAASAFLLAGGAFGQQQINLTAGPSALILPDGSSVPMWGYSCGALVTGSTASCAALNPGAAGAWSPVVITVPTGQDLQINLTNNLSFTPTSSTTPNNIPTSIVIVGQLGGGLGDVTQRTTTTSPDHTNAQPLTWPIAGTPPGQAPVGVGTPPVQGPRVQSFATEVAATPVTTAQTPTVLTWKGLRAGTYLIESGTHPSIQGPMGLYGILVVTSAPTVTGSGSTATETAPGTAYGTAGQPNAISYDAEVPLLLSEIDPVQNTAVNAAVNTAGFSETAVWSGQPGGCGNPASSTYRTCYPPAVNYTPLYYLFNGVAFDKTHAAASLFPVAPAQLLPINGTPENVLVRVVNAGLRMHVPSIVGSITQGTPGVPGISLIAEDGNVLPGVERVQSEVFMAAGKTYDVMITPTGGVSAVNVTSGGSGYTSPTVSFSGGGGSGAAAQATMTISNIVISSGGTGYVVGDALTFTGNGSGAAATVSTVDANGAITGVTISTGGSYTSAPTVGVTSAAGTGASLSATGSITTIAVTSPGSGYTSAPSVTINDSTGGSAVAAASVKPMGTLPIYDRELSLSGNAIDRDAGMLAYISIGGGGVPSAPALGAAVARADTYNSLVAGQNFAVTDPAKGLIANDTNVYGVKLAAAPTNGTVRLNADGTFTYVPTGTATTDSFSYCANGTTTICATVTLGAATLESNTGITLGNDSYAAAVGPTTLNAARLAVSPPGVLANDRDGAGYPLTVDTTTITPAGTNPPGLNLAVQPDGSLVATATAAGTYTFTYHAKNSQGTTSSASATVTLSFPVPSGLQVTVEDGATKAAIGDYRWIIEEDRTFYVDPKCQQNPPPSGCPGSTTGIVPTFGTNFHTSYMPVVATGCTGPLSCESGQTILDPTSGAHVNAVCDIGNGICEPDITGSGQTPVLPSQVVLNPAKRYYISVLPGDAANPFEAVNLTATCGTFTNLAGTTGSTCGHGMGGAPIAAACTPVPPATTCTPTAAPAVTILTQPSPYVPAKLSVFVFEDDFPLNGEQDGGGGIDVLSPNEGGLGGFNITLFDDAGGTGDATGQMTYDMFNQPLSNSLAGTIDPATGLDACPITKISRIGANDPNQTGITGTIVTCPKYESDNLTLSPLAGQAVIANMMPGRYGVVATPGADRIALGEEWLQTNTLDGQKAHDSFLRIGEPSYFQEFGPAGYHVSIGFANPAIINARKAGVCGGTDPNITGANCTNSVTGLVTTERMSRTPDERLYSSGSNDSFAFTQCYVSLGDPDGEDFAFTKCKADGTFTLSGLPDGDWRITVFDQWNDMLVDGLSTPVRLAGGTTTNLGQLAINQWQSNIYTSTFFDQNGNGVREAGEPGLTLVPTNNRFRDGSFSNFNNTDLNGNAGFNEIFPLFSWYVIETDDTRYKNTGTHVVYDAGGPADGTPCGTAVTPPTAPCGASLIGQYLANTVEQVSVPTNLRVPGAVYCASADCTGKSIAAGPASSDPPSACTTSPTTGATTCSTTLSTGRIDPPWVTSEGWQGFSGQNNFIEFGKKPFAPGENGGIHGHVVYASTRPFDDPQLLLQTSWEPLVPGVTINLYQEGTAADGITKTLKLVDTTKTSSWDDWAQGFRSDGVPNMNCPGQLGAPTTTASGDLFFFTLYNQPMYLDLYNNNGTPAHTIPDNSQFKCYDGMHNWNQVQPAPYDGRYQFPSIAGRDPVTGAAVGGTGSVAGTNCTVCVANPTDGTPMLPDGKYVVEVIVPPGYELVKEEDKNILIGDNYIAPVTVQFPGLGGAIYIVPDQASVAAVYNANQGSLSAYNANNAQNPTQALGRISSLPSHEGDTGQIETYWPCVGATRIVPDFISLFPQSQEVAPFAGATRNLCDRKEVTLDDQTSALAKFYIFTSTHAAAHFTGIITDDFTSEFDPFSPTWGEKFSPANLPVAIKDWTGTEISRVYSDQWGDYDGLTYSTWEVNPPNPTGYAPTMMVTCMNDAGSLTNPDPLYNPAYSQFCYEIPFMPGQTQYMDTPVVPTSAFAGSGYNNPDCAYPDATPAISEVDGPTLPGPWVSAPGQQLHIYALGNQTVNNYGYSGPSSTTVPYNQKTVTRHYGFGTRPSSCPTSGACPNVTIGGVAMTNVTTWTDQNIVGLVPTGVANCPIQQQVQYGGPDGTSAHPFAQCGELVITAANGKQSIDTVTVTIGGKAPKHVNATASIQAAIDAAAPGDMILIDPKTRATTTAAAVPAIHEELLLMWKPVRLQGVGAAASILDGNTHPAGKLDVWRRRVNCLFGLALNGQPPSATNPYDSTGTYTCPSAPANTASGAQANFSGTSTTLAYWSATTSNPQIDRLPLEAVVGWDATQNGNLAELLQEPSLMGALEGAGVTVLSKGMVFPAGSDPFGLGAAGAGLFPAGTVLLDGTSSTATGCGSNTSTSVNPFPSNFHCNPSGIDGVTVRNASQGGGGIYVHGWGHNMQIANDRVNNNSGTLSGGINVGQGEFPPSYTVGGTNADPNSCQSTTGLPTGTQLQYCFDVNVNMHHNMITLNSSTGDELFSATPAGAGGVTICNGSDYYKFNYNWVCGNLSTGDGGGIGHVGFSYGGDIEHNTILFNQSTNPTIATNGGGILVMGAPDVDPTCGLTTDQDCVPKTPNPPGDGVGPGLMINANLLMGNAAESGSGGGLRLQAINGTDVLTFPNNPENWYNVTVTNNIIANNVAGWDGAGISLYDALNVNIINNTIVSNDTTASSGVLFNTLGAPLASSSGVNCMNSSTSSCPQPAGVVAIQNSTNMTANLPTGGITCPAGHPNCATYSYPELYNNVIWQNRSFYIGVGSLGTGELNQQNTVALFDAFTATPAPSQSSTGNCPGGVSYWDIGARGDTGPGNHASGITLAPTYSFLTDVADYPGLNNSGSNPALVSQYCNGSRVPPENGGMGYNVPAGISDATVPNPIFNLTPTATVDEGNNWINISWGPLSLSNPATNATLGNYAIAAGSPAINYVPSTSSTYGPAPSTDFFGTARKTNNAVDAGAVEFVASNAPVASVTGGPLAFGSVLIGTTSTPKNLTLHNTGASTLTGIGLTFAGPFSRVTTGAFPTGAPNCGTTLGAGANCTIKVVFTPTTTGLVTGSLTIASSNAGINGSPVILSGTGVTVLLSPQVWTTSATRGCTVLTCPTQIFVLTNGGTTTLTGITQAALLGPDASEFTIRRALSTCGPAGNGQLLGQTTLAPGASCVVTVSFTPLTTQSTGAKSATLSVTDSAGTQTSALNGTAN